jgi:hypothetical protein
MISYLCLAATCSDYSGPLKGLGLTVGLDSKDKRLITRDVPRSLLLWVFVKEIEGIFSRRHVIVLSTQKGAVDQPEDRSETWAPACEYLYCPQMAHWFYPVRTSLCW